MHRSIRRLAAFLLMLLGTVTLGLTYWQFVRADELAYSPYNPRLVIQENRVIRGRMLDRTGQLLVESRRTASGMQRRYADPSIGHITGYFSQRYGASGLEQSHARYLRGDLPRNPIDAAIGDLLDIPRVGADLHLTIDARLQKVATGVMGSDTGAVVAIDPRSGAVLAMVSAPHFDPSRLDEQWSQLQRDPAKPLFNRATQGLYTPGSVFKIVTAAAAIDLGLVDLDRAYRCTEDLVVDGFRIENRNHPELSTVTFVQDFAFSCNATFARIGLSLDTSPIPLGDGLSEPPPWTRGIDETRRRFVDYARRFGLDVPLPFDLPTATSRIGSQPLSRVELATSAFGQGELQVTPLLMALGAATIANGGRMPHPYLVQKATDGDGNTLLDHTPRPVRDVISADTATAMNRLMVASVQEGYARSARISGIQVAGKTGSAETGQGQKTHSWFIGYAPADSPTIAVAVIMENKGSGSEFAAPAARAVMEAALGTKLATPPS